MVYNHFDLNVGRNFKCKVIINVIVTTMIPISYLVILSTVHTIFVKDKSHDHEIV